MPIIFLTAMVGGERDLPRKTDEWMLSSSSFFLSVSLSAPTFGLSIRARDTNSTFFSSVVMNLKTQKIGRKQKKRGRLETIPSSCQRKIPNFSYYEYYAELFGWSEFTK